MCIVVVYRSPPLWAPSMHVKQLYHGVSRENQKQKTVYLTNFTCINRTIELGLNLKINFQGRGKLFFFNV